MYQLFINNHKLKSLDLSNFYTPALETMNLMFSFCESLESLDIRNFNTKKIDYMALLFRGCKSLKYLDLRNFDTSSVTEMAEMFYDCHSLTSIEISSFDTSQVTNMGHMFYECRSLKSLDLAQFKTPIIIYVYHMYYNCHSLEYLDVINYNTEKTYNYENMFFNTTSLISLNLTNFKVVAETVVTNIIKDIKEDVILCYNESQVTAAFITEVNGHENSCKKVCDLGPRIYIEEADKCVDNCYHSGTKYIYEYNRTCYTACPEGTKFYSDTELCEDCRDYYTYDKKGCLDSVPDGYYNDNPSAKTIQKCPNECTTCSLYSVNNNLCIDCNNEGQYYYKSDDTLNTGSFHKCYNKDAVQTDYYLDNNIYKRCYSKCKTCNEAGNDENNHCTECYNLDAYELKDGNCINLFDYTYEASTASEDLKNNYIRTFIDMNEKEISHLKNAYSLDKNSKIFISISENIDSNLATADYVYEYLLEDGTKLDLDNLEEDIYIDVYVPIRDLNSTNFELAKKYAEEGYDIYNLYSKFYTDFCTPVSLDGNDIPLSERKKEIYPNNITLCKSNCIYQGVDLENQRVICQCNLNNKSNDNLVQNNENFISYTVDYINYKLFLCYKLFFDAYYIKHSYAFFIILIIFMIILTFDIIFLIFTLGKLKAFMIKQIPSDNKLSEEPFSESKKCNDDINNVNKIAIEEIKANPKKKELTKNKNGLNKSKTLKKRTSRAKILFTNEMNGKLDNAPNKTEEPFKEEIKSEKKIKSKKHMTEDETNFKEKNKEDNKEEEDINELPYSKAIELDKRNVFHIFYTFLIGKLEFINIFCNSNKIKIMLFAEYILSLLINFFFNALLYSDEVVSHKYHNNGQLDFLVSLVLSIISNIVTSILCYFLKYSTGIDEKIELILELKHDKNYPRVLEKFYLYLKVKFIFFFLAQIIVFALCLYYIEIFCVKYYCSQINLVINYCYSFIESIITSLAFTFIIVLTRKIGLSCMNKGLYNTSKYINNKT